MPKTRKIKTVTVVSNSSKLIQQTLAEIIPSEFVVKSESFSSIKWKNVSSLPQSITDTDCLILDLTLDFLEFENVLKQLRDVNKRCKLIVLNDFRSAAFIREAHQIEGVDSFINMSDFPEKIERELKSGSKRLSALIKVNISQVKANH